jgi:hypothetical protein
MAVLMMLPERIGPQGANPEGTDNNTHQTAATSQYTAGGMRDASLRAVAP